MLTIDPISDCFNLNLFPSDSLNQFDSKLELDGFTWLSIITGTWILIGPDLAMRIVVG